MRNITKITHILLILAIEAAITSCSLDSVTNTLKEMDKLSSGGKDGSSSSGEGGGDSNGSCGSVTIGTQTWQKCNLDVVPSTGNSACYDNNPSNCAKYGRLYDWAAAMALPDNCNSSVCASQISAKHRGICPSGWHIPSIADWNKLFKFVDNASNVSGYCGYSICDESYQVAGRYLKSTRGWDSNGNGQDTYGFAALPGGSYYSLGNADPAGEYGYWWSSSEDDANIARFSSMFINESASWYDNLKTYYLSVRCLKD